MLLIGCAVKNPDHRAGDRVKIDCRGSRGTYESYDGTIATVMEVKGFVHIDIDQEGHTKQVNAGWEYKLELFDGSEWNHNTVMVDLLPVNE